jgi:general secretion pathway protein A
MYEAFFGLRERPFDLAPNPRFLFITPCQHEALGNLRYGLTSGRGLTLLLGDAGTGKTTLIQAVLRELDGAAVDLVLLNNPTLTRNEFCEFLARGFSLSADARLSKTAFLHAFREKLESNHEAGRTTALIVDEAQSMPSELLEEIRLLSNMDLPDTKLLNVVLAGQPELADRLNQRGLRQLKQRIALRCEIVPFDVTNTASYVAGRLRIGGGSPAKIFSREAVIAICEASRGIPRTINVICDNALISGFAAQIKPVPRAIVEEVVRDFDLRAADVTGSKAFFRNADDAQLASSRPGPDETATRESREADGLFALGSNKQTSYSG